jgi:hypothetical protein
MANKVAVIRDFLKENSVYKILGVDTLIELTEPISDKVDSRKPVIFTIQALNESKSKHKIRFPNDEILRNIVEITPNKGKKPSSAKIADKMKAKNYIARIITEQLGLMITRGNKSITSYWGDTSQLADKMKQTSASQQPSTSLRDKGKKPEHDDETGEQFYTMQSADAQMQSDPPSPILGPMQDPDLSMIPTPSMQLSRDILEELRKLNGVIVNVPPPGLPRLPANMDARSLQDALDQGYTLMKLEHLAATRANPVQFAGHLIAQIDPDGRMEYSKSLNIRMKAQDVARNGFNPEDLVQLSRDIMKETTDTYEPEHSRARIRGRAQSLAIARKVRDPKKKRY